MVSERLSALSGEEAQTLVRGLRGEALDRCGRDGRFWLQFVQTRDEADPGQTTKPFPVHLDYVLRIWDTFTAHNRVVVAKSRQMLLSWIACAFMCHTARFRPNSLVILQTQKWEDACAMVAMAGNRAEGGYAGRCQFIESHLPSWLRQRCTPTEGAIDYPNGSRVMALAAGANQIRGKTASLIVLDEYAFLSEAKQTYAAISPLVQKGCKIIVISTPNGAEGNSFFHLWNGVPMVT
mgnify:FL=1